MSLEQLKCPACAAAVSVSPGASQATCAYCGATLRVQRSDGENTLLLAEKVTDAIADSGAQTKAAIGESTAVTREELRRIQLTQELAGLELRLTTLQSEIRSLQRMPSNKVTGQQLAQLGKQEADLQVRIAQLHAALNPPPPPSTLPTAAPPAVKSKSPKTKPAQAITAEGETKRRGCVGWTLLVLAWFFFWPFMLPWTMIRSQKKPVRIAGYVVAVIVAIYFLLFLFAPRKPRAPVVETPAAFAPPQTQLYVAQSDLVWAVQ